MTSAQRYKAGAIVLAVLLFVLCAPQALQSADQAPQFDGANALAVATHLAGDIGDRAAGTTGEEVAVAWLAEQFTDLGYEVELQAFQIVRNAVPYTATNVIATKPGIAGYDTITVGAHLDTVLRTPDGLYGGPGANDNASGTAILLESARLLSTESLSTTVKFIAFSAEEIGLTGSFYYVTHMRPIDRVRAMGMINIDCAGLGDLLGLHVFREQDLAFAEGLGIDADVISRAEFMFSDHIPFAVFGVPSVLVNHRPATGHACGPDYHRPGDTPDKLELSALARAGAAVVTGIYALTEQAQPHTVHWMHFPSVGRNFSN